MESPILVGIGGGTASGKTTVARKIAQAFTNTEVIIIEQDSYYKDLSHLPRSEREAVNFDHPDAIDFALLHSHLRQLAKGQAIAKPAYDFHLHLRQTEAETVEPARIIIVEGILVLAVPNIRELFQMKIFVDTDDDERLLRRIERDIYERGRSFESISSQYRQTVKPMHLEFVEPSKRYADVIIPRGGQNRVGIRMVIAKLRTLLNDHEFRKKMLVLEKNE